MEQLPVIDVAGLRSDDPAAVDTVARQIDDACRRTGFFYISGHGVPADLRQRLDRDARRFFALDDAEKAHVAMSRGGRAWRGWFPVGGELTAGVPDHKEGIYFGEELAADDPRVRTGTPLHGPNLFPARPPGLRRTVLDYLSALTALGHDLVRGVGVGLGLDGAWFDRNLTGDPLVLFRIFHYPPHAPADGWGVAEHTDYGLLTILLQDATGGLEVHGPSGWISAPPIPDTFVVNLGDMLERMTGGVYRSTPHRVRNTTHADRLSFPFFFDPGWDRHVRPVPLADADIESTAGRDRWDGRSVHDWSGTYGDYLLDKVSRVFPALGADVLD